MRNFFIILLITNGLCFSAIGQGFIPMNLVQPPVLTASAGNDTLVCTGHSIVLGGKPSATGGNGSYLYMWSPPDGLDNPTAPNPTATLSESKSYMLSVFDAQGCQDVSFVSVYVDPCLGVQDNQLSEKLTVFPNPTNGIITIQGINTFKSPLQKIEVINELGQIVFYKLFNQSGYISDILLDTKIEMPGIYFLKISLSDHLVSHRLIVR